MKRSGPIARSPMRKKPPRRVAKETAVDVRYRHWIHFQFCWALQVINDHDCYGRIEMAHERNMTGLGLKEPSRRSIPLCSRAHSEFDQHRGPFAGWTKERRREWFADGVEVHQAAFTRGAGVPF